ncbi:MAG: hypothetical protein ACK4IX_17195 [Candidatus Sericytochromatia bacterium]
MIASTTLLPNTETTFYTVPIGKELYAELVIYPISIGTITCKINNLILFSSNTSSQISYKLILQEGDTIKLTSTTQANAFLMGVLL